MAGTAKHLSKNVLQNKFNPVICFVRHGHRKPNTKKPVNPSWERACMDAVTKPIYPEFINPRIPPWVTSCKDVAVKKVEEVKVNKYEELLVADVKKIFDTKKMVIVCQNNAYTSYEHMDARILLFNNQMAFDMRGSNIYRQAAKGTEVEKCNVLFQGFTCLIHSDSSDNLKKFMKVEKKIPFVVVLGGIIEGRVMNREQLSWVAGLPDIDTLRGELVGLLGMQASKLSQSLSHHQTELSQNLNQLVQDSSKGEPTSSE